MIADKPVETARTLMADDKGLLAIDESSATCNRRFAELNIAQTEQARRAYRELIITTPGLGESISGMILYDETIRQRTKDGTPFIKVLADAGIVPGIKVDTGTIDLVGHPGETITEGLDGLRGRLQEYHQMGARFAKWRAVIALGDGRPSPGCIEADAMALARYASLCQESGIVPIVEAEVLMNGEHGLERSRDATDAILWATFDQLHSQKVILEGLILKPSTEIEPDLTEWDYGAYEGQKTEEIWQQRPGWNLFRDGCPGGEMPAQISDRADRIIARLGDQRTNIAVFSHGQCGCALAARWIGLPVIEAQHFLLYAASLSILGYNPSHPEVRVISSWNDAR